MVMDATQNQQPSPQSVGREFVRQYYTLLNKAPNHLHRFYNTNSSFIHGESTLVVGQKNIHNRIQQLNFHDCHAKISQVDAQATLGNGVVVQVTGELSNDGQPMRRFTQTFVLGAQSPKKYYVHNDIFRYQDMYPEEDNDGDSRSENGDENEALSAPVVNEQPPQAVGGLIADQQQTIPNQVVVTSAGVMPVIQQSGAPQQQTIYYSMPPAGGRPMPVLAPPQAAAVPLGAQFATGGATNIPQHQVAATPTVSQLNGVVGHEDLLTTMPQPSAGQQPLAAQAGSPVMQATSVAVAAAPMLASQTTGGVAVVPVPNTGLPQNTTGIITGFPQNPVMQQQMIQQPSLSNNQPNIMHSQGPPILSGHLDGEDSVSPDVNSRTSPATLVPRQPTPAPIVEDFKTINDQQQQAKYEAAKQQQHQQNEPKTYANLFKSTSSSPSGFVNAAMQQQQQLQQQQQQQSGFQPTTISTSTFTQSNTAPSLSSYNNNRNNESSSLRLDNNSGPLPQRNNSRMNKGDFDQRRSSNPQFGDNQQLFLGNIPHHASEEELKTLFGRFGTVLELRILSKPGGNKIQPGVRNPLNYGFITYDDPEAVQNCLSHCPLYFPENTPDAQKLNVEEKKPRVRPNDIPRQSMGNNVNNNVNNAQRNNMSGGGGPPSRPLSNSGGGMMRGPRIGGAFNRNESRSNGGGGSSQVRGNNNSQSGGGSYGSRR